MGVGKGVMYDAAMAIETIEHCRNIRALLDAVGKRLRPGAALFVQSLCHQSASYLVDSRDGMVAKYGRQFYEGFRAFYYVCVEAFAANDGAEFMVAYYIFRAVKATKAE